MTEHTLFIRQMEKLKNAKSYQDFPLIVLLEYEVVDRGHEQREYYIFFSSPSAVLICSAELNVNRYFAVLLSSNCIIFHKFTSTTAENHESHVFFSSIKYYLLLTLGWSSKDI